MKLLYFCVRSYSCLYYFLLFENIKASFKKILILFTFTFLLFDSYGAHTPKEYLKNGLHIVNKHFLKLLFLLIQLWIILLLPHLVNYAFIDVPVSDMRQEML